MAHGSAVRTDIGGLAIDSLDTWLLVQLLGRLEAGAGRAGPNEFPEAGLRRPCSVQTGAAT